MQKTDLTARAVAAFIDLLIIMGLVRLPDVIGSLAAVGYILIRDGLFTRQSVGKKLVGLHMASSEGAGAAVSYRESIVRNVTFAAAFLLFHVPFAGWALGPLALAIEGLAALGDERGMRIGDIIARTVILPVPAAGASSSAIDQQPDFGEPREGGTQRDSD